MKKRRTALILAAIMLLTAVLTACAREGNNSPSASQLKKLVSEMSTAEKVTQMMLLRFKNWGLESDSQPVTQLNSQQQELLTKHSFGGVIVFTENMQTAEQSVKLIESMRLANQAGGAKTDLLVGIDQEGGYITRIATGTQLPGNMALGAAGDAETAKKAAGVIGSELSALGIDIDFAPVLDINNNPDNPIIGLRSFSDDPKLVSEMGAAFVEGLQSKNIGAAIKHFPGHGNTDTDSHSGLPLISSTMEELEKLELVPFKAGIDAGADIVMTAHIQYPKIETGTYVSKSSGENIFLPATLSKTILTDTLRTKLGFKGVIVTDSMVMDAIAEHFDPLDAAKLAINAGADMLTVPMETRTQAEISSLEKYIDGIVAMVVSGEIPSERIDEAVTRILTLKIKLGRREIKSSGSVDEKVRNAQAVVGSKANHDAEWEVTKKAITLVKNSNALPLKAAEKTVLVCPYASELLAMEYGIKKLKEDGKIPQSAEITCLCYNGMTSEAEKIASGAVNVVAISTMYGKADLDPAKTEWTAFLDDLCAAIHKKGGRFIAVSSQLPYDTARFTAADAILAAYNARGMTKDPGNFAPDTPQFAPNIPAAVYCIFGGFAPTGKLPVSVPKLNADYSYSSEILFERGTGLSW